MCENYYSHKQVDPNADSKAIAIFFRQLNFSGKDSQHVKMFFACFQLFPAISANQQILMSTIKMLCNRSAPSGRLQYPSIQMHVSANLPCCLIIAGAPSIVTENIFISIPLSSKFFVKVPSISFPLAVPCIGFKQQSSSCTSPLL